MRTTRRATVALSMVLLLGCVNRECCLPDPCSQAARTTPTRGQRGTGSARLNDELVAIGRDTPAQQVQMLALSGGGLFGAFGSGLVNGWFEAGGRPKFDVVTGISTGSLQAPFVFLHTREAAGRLKKAYTTVGASDIIEMRPLITVPFSSSLATANGLKKMLKTYVTNGLIDLIATEAKSGERKLLIGTANLDTGCLDIWDMGEIAGKKQYALFRQVLLASSAMPPAMPPVCINGQYHTDGGAREQVFVPRILKLVLEGHDKKLHKFQRGGTSAGPVGYPGPPLAPAAYNIVNGAIGLFPHCTQPQILDVALRSTSLLIDEALVGNLWKTWGTLQLHAQRTTGKSCDNCFYVVSMPPCALGTPTGSLDLSKADMQKLYRIGHEMGSKGIPWLTTPEGLGCSGTESGGWK